MAKMNDLPDVVAYLFAKGLDDFYNPLENGEWKNVDIMEENYMYGDYTQSDDEDDDFDLYGGNYCLVQFKEYGVYDVFGQSWETMVSTADFDIGSIREDGVRSLSFNEGVLCDVSPDNILNITRLSESEYMEACEMKACDGESVHLVI